MPQLEASEVERLRRAVASAVGIYQDPVRSKKRGAANVVLVAHGNIDYAAILLNWMCYARNLGR